jgi:PAS domain S-box-containing protein
MFNNADSRFWKTVIDTLQEGIMLVDPAGKITFVNKIFEKLLGYSIAELKGETCEVFQCDRCFGARIKGRDKYCALFKEEEVRSSECIFIKKDGTPIHLLKNAAVIRNSRGEVIGGVESLTDLSNVVAKEREIACLREQLHYNDGFQGIVGNSPVMRQLFDLATSVAHSDAPLIIYGESGTGKELLAAAVHQLSERAEKPFVKVNCAALNDNLLESELFGHVKGAFTGAEFNRVGRFEAAHGGSIFLDEVGDLPYATQTKLLRVLQEKEIERVGDLRPVKIDVRIIAATHKDLQQLIKEGLFREDLYYRIGVVPIYIPPLRERQADIPLLTETFIKRIQLKTKKQIDGISREAIDLLINYSWPGNVRELINVIEYAFVLCPGGEITPRHLPAQFQSERQVSSAPHYSPRRHKNDFRRQKLIDALQASAGNQSKAARILGVSRVTVWKWIKKYGVTVDTHVHS